MTLKFSHGREGRAQRGRGPIGGNRDTNYDRRTEEVAKPDCKEPGEVDAVR